MFCDDVFITSILIIGYTDGHYEPMYQNDTNMLNNYRYCYVIIMTDSK
ncbi:hypothetical protein HMPREF1982_01194 [Clostridiales bacterium oral taxon 876 str. F0540]|nr:hypothetical protein HMPREF1982_01194 [Clostridiales bacterium oral taxon 876 str. F0540]